MSDDLDALCRTGLVEKIERASPTGQPQERYTLTPAGQEQVTVITGRYPAQSEEVARFVKQVLDVFGTFDPDTLIAAGKALCLGRDQGWPVTEASLRDLALDYGLTLNLERVPDVAQLIHNLNRMRDLVGGRSFGDV